MKTVPPMTTDAEAEAFLDQDLTDLDFAQFKPVSWEVEPKSARINMRLPEKLMAALKQANVPIVGFVNADLLAAGLSPLDPRGAQLAAGRLFLSELDRHSAGGNDFAFESTLSGLTYLPRLRTWQKAGYRIEIIYLS